ncbi:hypothetical protein IWX65_003428 [Arthrobacter sp. CAN_A214]|uniref:hypothetical protein n=1 Tax=Arthrobacter sp. CAN_A214 TaxID=2787720 RepID=UPI0018CBBA89
MEDITEEVRLTPAPEVVTGLINLIVTSPWPKGEGERGEYFQRLGFLAAESPADLPDSPSNAGGELLATGMGFTEGSWMSFRGGLLSIDLFLYKGLQGTRTLTVTGYHALQSQLAGIYGAPLNESLASGEHPSSTWHIQDISIELYSHLDRTPVVQLKASHIQRNASYKDFTTSLSQN